MLGSRVVEDLTPHASASAALVIHAYSSNDCPQLLKATRLCWFLIGHFAEHTWFALSARTPKNRAAFQPWTLVTFLRNTQTLPTHAQLPRHCKPQPSWPEPYLWLPALCLRSHFCMLKPQPLAQRPEPETVEVLGVEPSGLIGVFLYARERKK